MTRRAMVALAALLGVVGVLLGPATSQAAPSAAAAVSAVSPQVQLPPGFENQIRRLLTEIFNSVTSFMPSLRGILRPIFNRILQTLFGGGCSPPFCASP